jgi:hypothetical protein
MADKLTNLTDAPARTAEAEMYLPFVTFASRTLVIGGIAYALDMGRPMLTALKVGAVGAAGAYVSGRWVESAISAAGAADSTASAEDKAANAKKMAMYAPFVTFTSRTLIIGGIVYALDIERPMLAAAKVGAVGAAGAYVSDMWVEKMVYNVAGYGSLRTDNYTHSATSRS